MKKYILLILFSVIIQYIIAVNPSKNKSVLADGYWIKVSTVEQGIHKITYSQLSSWGINNIDNVSVYSNGGYMLPEFNNVDCYDDLEKIPVIHDKDINGDNAIFFFSTGSIQWKYDSIKSIFTQTQNLYSDKTYFFITSDKTKSNSPQVKTSLNNENTQTVYDFNAYQLYEKNVINFQKSGSVWYSDNLTKSIPFTISFNLPNVLTNEKAFLNVSAAAVSSNKSQLNIYSNNNYLDSIFYYKIERENAYPKTGVYELNPDKKLDVKLSYQSKAQDGQAWLDFISINYTSKLVFTDKQLIFRNTKALNQQLLKYQIESKVSNLVLWDISNPIHPLSLNYSKNGNIIEFTDEGFCEYLLFDVKNNEIQEPVFVEEVENQNIHGHSNYDMIIVSHPDFIASSEKLAEFHRQYDQLKVLVLNSFQVYNEFSSGIPDASGIRNMVRMFYKRSKGTKDSLKYLLLMGDGSYNNWNHTGSVHNYIPTYQSDGGSSFCSDDFYALLDDYYTIPGANNGKLYNEGQLDGYIDIGVGRIPCQTEDEAEIVIQKTINYASPESMGDWRNILAFMADDEELNRFMQQSDSLINIVNDKYPGFYSEKIYFDAFPQISSSDGESYPEATKAMNKRVEEGALILNYIGHANETSMASENVLEINSIKSWSNKKKLPVFVTATCEFSRFDYDNMSAGEHVLFHEAGGGVALFSTTRQVYLGANYKLSIAFYNSVFQYDENGDNVRMGDIIRLTKNRIAVGDKNKRSFALLGDPALRLSFPKYNVITKKINGFDVADTLTIGALDEVTVEGEITDNFGNLLTNFEGDVTAIVYDKELMALTLGNDADPKYEYKVRNNKIYKGVSTVVNGTFSFSFIVPKDISYNIGTGKIFYYFSNDSIDGNGSTEQFKIGGSSKNPMIDSDPPEMTIYLNDESFRSNDRVASSSLLFVNLYDESGINTVGTGIGHDIVAIIDDDESNPITLNDYYSSDKDTYKSGKVGYPINNLSPGEHKISVRAWDIQNNSITDEITFIVEEGFEIISVSNYPNPVKNQTKFKIIHNLPGDVFDIKVQIFNLRGNKIDEINESSGSYGTTQVELSWNLFECNYPVGNEDILIYRVQMENIEGLSATGAGKLLINKF